MKNAVTARTRRKRTLEFYTMYPADYGELDTPCAYTPKEFSGIEEERRGRSKRILAAFKDMDELPCVLTLDKGLVCDYLPNNMGYPLMSERLKKLLDEEVEDKRHRWLMARVLDRRDNREYLYHIPLFENYVDTIDYKNSRYLDKKKTEIIIARHSLKKIGKLEFFPKHNKLREKVIGEKTPYFIDNFLIVSARLRRRMEEERRGSQGLALLKYG